MDLKIYDEKDFPSYLPKLGLLYDDLFAGGKGARGKLVRTVCEGIGAPDRAVHLLAQTIEFIHNASLLHDDLVDRSSLRRGKPTAWLQYTPEYAVLAGDYLLARVMVNLSSYGRLGLVHYTAEMISDLLEGEWLQDSLVGDMFVERKQLDRVHGLKTASLFKWCLRAPFLAVDRNDEKLHQSLQELGAIMGLLFQRSDDLLDFNVRNFEQKKPLGDLVSGYVNSFAAFAVPMEDRNQLKLCKDLESFVNAVGGKAKFDQKLMEFDRINTELLDLFDHHLGQLEEQLPVEEKSLVSSLRPIASYMYWREKPRA